MTVELQLKDLILSRYRSIREFTIAEDIPYTTVDSIFRRGIGNSSVSVIIKICKALGISADELADGRITSVIELNTRRGENPREIQELLSRFKFELTNAEDLTLEGEPVDRETVSAIAQGIDVSYEMVIRYNKNHNKNVNKN
jgi:hypothetical protein